MQNEKMDVIECHKLLKRCQEFLADYRTNGFNQAIVDAKELATILEAESVFKSKRISRVKQKPGEKARDEPIVSPQKKFEVEFFNPLLDEFIMSINERFSQFNEHLETWNFLYNFENLPIEQEELLQKCLKLQESLTVDEIADIDGVYLSHELKRIRSVYDSKENSTPINVLNFIKKNQMEEMFPNIWISLRILLTFPVTVASGERSFSKLKLIKTYLRSTISQEQLNHLAKLSIENQLAKTINFDEVISRFAGIKSRKINV